MTTPKRVNLKSLDIAKEKRKQLKQLFPEVFSESKVDFKRLKRVLGQEVEPGQERFGLIWPGKAECMKVIQQPSVATLKPDRDGSVNFDDTKNMFIEGDNLEVLKLLQKSYFGKVKMIYIDPPYNTGNEFIYPDKYSETLETYLEYTGQKDTNGQKFSTNAETNGRYHSRWLSMMYPRLYLARSLLRDDGVMFISIDDNELANLRKICDEIFGEESFAGVFPWRSRTAKADVPYGVSVDTEWVICYAKPEFIAGRTGERNYHESDDYPDRWRLQDLTNNKTKDERPNSYFTMVNPKNGAEYPANENRVWSVTKDTFQEYYDKGKIVFPGDYDFLNIKRPAFRVFESEDKQKAQEKYGTEETKMSVSTYLPEKDVGRTEHGSKEIRELFGSPVFQYPKPTGLIKFFIKNISDADAIVMDFFAGSGTTADAVLQANEEDGGNRKYILVQLPETLDPSKGEHKPAVEYCKARSLDLKITELSKERIRLAAHKIMEKQSGRQTDMYSNTEPDLGFKVFKLSQSNFKVWEGDAKKADDLEEQIFQHVDHVDNSSTPEDIFYELLLKTGFPLTTDVEKLTLSGKEVFSVEDGSLLICLDKDVTEELIDAIAKQKPSQIIFLDQGFKGNDQLKVNAVQAFRTRAQQEETEIVFRTV